MIKALKGMKDILPPQNEKFTHFLENASQIAQKYGYEFIETPILEETLLYKRGVGDSSDIVGKEMYEFIDKGGNEISLRPEGTAGVVRSFIEAKYDRVGGIYRFFYHGPMFRYERPQKGRFRQFHQFGCESFGTKSGYEDANIIKLLKEILDSFHLNYTLKLNTLGCPKCITPYKEILQKELHKIDELCSDCQRRRDTNPIRVFDCKNSHCQELLKEVPRLNQHLCDECESDFSELLNLLDLSDITYEIDPNLVRGLDYYTKTAFEFISGDLGSQNAIAGGGRYDKLVELMGGKPTPAIGFAIGIERILELITLPKRERGGYYFGALDDSAMQKLFIEAGKKRALGERVIQSYDAKSLKAHLKTADKINARYCAILGEDEIKNNKLWIKDLENKKEFTQEMG